MEKVTVGMLEYHNSICGILRTHCRGWRVLAYLSDGSKVCGEVFVKKGKLFINREAIDNKIITEVYYTDRRRSDRNEAESRSQTKSTFEKNNKGKKKSGSKKLNSKNS